MKKMKLSIGLLSLIAMSLVSWTSPVQPDKIPHKAIVEACSNAEMLPPECYTQAHLLQFLSCYGTCGASPCTQRWDFTGDTCVGAADLVIFIGNLCQ